MRFIPAAFLSIILAALPWSLSGVLQPYIAVPMLHAQPAVPGDGIITIEPGGLGTKGDMHVQAAATADQPPRTSETEPVIDIQVSADGKIAITQTKLFHVERFIGSQSVAVKQFPDLAPFLPVRLEVIIAARGGTQIAYFQCFDDEALWPHASVHGYGSADFRPLEDRRFSFTYEAPWFTTDQAVPRWAWAIIAHPYEDSGGWPPVPLFPDTPCAIEGSALVHETIEAEEPHDLDWLAGDGCFQLDLTAVAYTVIGGVVGQYACTSGGVELGIYLIETCELPGPDLRPAPPPGPGDER